MMLNDGCFWTQETPNFFWKTVIMCLSDGMMGLESNDAREEARVLFPYSVFRSPGHIRVVPEDWYYKSQVILEASIINAIYRSRLCTGNSLSLRV